MEKEEQMDPKEKRVASAEMGEGSSGRLGQRRSGRENEDGSSSSLTRDVDRFEGGKREEGGEGQERRASTEHVAGSCTSSSWSSSTTTEGLGRAAAGSLSVGTQDVQPGGIATPFSSNSSPHVGEEGGMLVGPRHPYFSGGRGPGGFPMPPLPPGFTPPAPRFDPIGPYGVEPNPDHDAHPPWGEPQQPGAGPPGTAHPLAENMLLSRDSIGSSAQLDSGSTWMQPHLPTAPRPPFPSDRPPGLDAPPGFGFGGGGFGGGSG